MTLRILFATSMKCFLYVRAHCLLRSRFVVGLRNKLAQGSRNHCLGSNPLTSVKFVFESYAVVALNFVSIIFS